MTTTVTLVFLISTYFIQKRINSLVYKDIVLTLDDMNYKIKEAKAGEIVDIINDYTETYSIDKILRFLSVLPICNVIHATHNVLIYIKEKDIIIDEILEEDLVKNNNSDIHKKYSLENNKANETNNYYLDEGKPKMMVKKKSK